MTKIRVATYNIRKSLGLDRSRDPARILKVLEQINPDIVALQEVDFRTGRRETTIPRDMIANETEYTVAEVAIRPDSIGWHGNTFLFKNTVTIDRLQHLELPILEPRGAILADISVNGVALRMVGLHLALMRSQRRRQLRSLADQINSQSESRPTILMGDLNEWKRTSNIFAPFSEGFTIGTPGASFHAAKPIASLDRIIASNCLKFDAQGVHRSAQAKIASDHLPIWADISVRLPAVA